MDDRVAADLTVWEPFYSAVAGAAATLVGLLFVVIALNPGLMASRGPTGFRTWAGLTFHNFIVVLAVSLVSLIPSGSEIALGSTLIVVGVIGVRRIIADARRTQTDPEPRWHRRTSLVLFGSPLLAHAIGVAVGIAVLTGADGAIDWLVAVIFLLLLGAASSCLELLEAIGDRQMGEPSAPPPAPPT